MILPIMTNKNELEQNSEQRTANREQKCLGRKCLIFTLKQQQPRIFHEMKMLRSGFEPVILESEVGSANQYTTAETVTGKD